MKKLNPTYLFYFAGILWIFAGIISEDMRWGYALGFAFIALGIAMKIKNSPTEDSEVAADSRFTKTKAPFLH